MAREGYTVVTLDDKLVRDIDSFIDADDDTLNSRPKVVRKAIDRLGGKHGRTHSTKARHS